MKALFLAVLALFVTGHAIAHPQAAAPRESETRLIPGDLIRVEIWREEDLSGEFLVDENGTVILPLLGERRVTDIPFFRLRGELIEAYREELRNPSIVLTPLRRINVLGEVNEPGLYNVDPTITLANVVALAGGANAIGDITRIRIVRDGVLLPGRVSASSTVTTIDLRSGDQVLVERRGWFERNSTFVVSVLLSVSSIVISLVR